MCVVSLFINSDFESVLIRCVNDLLNRSVGYEK